MDNEEKILQMLGNIQKDIQALQSDVGSVKTIAMSANARLSEVERSQDIMQKDITYIREQGYIAYRWVDGIDLRVKALERG